jgi:hypothetical protein
MHRMTDWRDDFFVGWSGRLPRRHAPFLRACVVTAVAVFLLLGLALARSTDDPGNGAVDWDAGEKTFRGVLTTRPYPLLHLADGRALMMAGPTQIGPEFDPALDGKMVEATGVVAKRGTLDMLDTNSPLSGVEGQGSVAPPVPLGRWRITGEICDGKCYSGSMRPGNGLAHKACANFCILGGVPPVFVSTAPVEGASFMLLADAAGGPLPDRLYDLVALRLQLEGELERRGDLLVFKVNLAHAVVP